MCSVLALSNLRCKEKTQTHLQKNKLPCNAECWCISAEWLLDGCPVDDSANFTGLLVFGISPTSSDKAIKKIIGPHLNLKLRASWCPGSFQKLW